MKGFTLAEILVVVAIVAFIGTILVAIFVNTLRGSNKSQILSTIKQNGQAILENMDKTVRGSDEVICLSSPTPDTLVLRKDSLYTRFRINLPPACSSNGCILSDNPVLGAETFDQFRNRVCRSDDSMVSPVILSDTNTQTGVLIQSGSFEVDQQPGYKEEVKINFILKPGTSAPSAISSQIDPVTFQTSVVLR